MKTTARLIITLDCKRKCHYCCNTTAMLDQAKHIADLTELDNYSEICVTGGEPMLYPDKTYGIIKKLKRPKRKIYLYTALATDTVSLFQMLMCGLDGIHYTLHYNSDVSDIVYGLQDIERLSLEFPTGKSFRLWIDQELKRSVTIQPSSWNRVESFAFIEDCPLPKSEDLFILENL